MTKKIEYVIWGIHDDHGYLQSIASSFDNNVIPQAFKSSNSFDDKHEEIMFDFSNENNSNNNYLYSIERVDNSVLYTIYRTNWYRGSRESYDAISLIIDKNFLLENASISLKKIMSHYVALKDSGIRNFNIDDLVLSLNLIDKLPNQKRKITSNSSHPYRQNNDKKAFVKYSSESELQNVLIDQKSSLFKFNKVFFFTGLKTLEEGPHKLVNLKDFHPVKIKIDNFDSRYHLLYIDGVDKPYHDAFDAYEGDKIEVSLKSTGKVVKSISVDSNTNSIKLDYIEPPKPKKPKKPLNPRTKENIIFISIIFVMSLIIIGLLFGDELKTLTKKINFFGKTNSEEPSDVKANQNSSLVYATLNGNKFFDQDNKEITNPDSLNLYFYKNKLVVDSHDYFYENDIIYISLHNQDVKRKLETDELINLNEKLSNLDLELTHKIRKIIGDILFPDIHEEDENSKEKSKKIEKEKDEVKKKISKTDAKIKTNKKKVKSTKSAKKTVTKDCSASEQMNKLIRDYKHRSNNLPAACMKKLLKEVRDEYDAEKGKHKHRDFLNEFLNAMEACNCEKCKNYKTSDNTKKSYNKLKREREDLDQLDKKE
tara:strand:- start:6238 stop:8022 length:1785 start_codon:yes stop_codon:yes gene_type:complete